MSFKGELAEAKKDWIPCSASLLSSAFLAVQIDWQEEGLGNGGASSAGSAEVAES